MTVLIGQDPDWAQRQSERLGDALRIITESKIRREAREEAEIQKYIYYISERPELADTVGQELVRKHGRKNPQLVSLVSTIQHENELKRNSQKQLDRFSQAYAKEIGDRQRFYDTVESMPDEMPMSLGLMGPTVPLPNIAKQAARSQQATMAAPEWSAFSKLSDEERYAVMVAMQREGIKIPEAPEGIGPEDLSQAQRGLVAMGLDLTSPEFQRTALSEAGEIETPAAVAKRTEDKKVEENKNDRELRERLEAEARAATEFDRRQGVSATTQRGLIDYRNANRPASANRTPEEKAKRQEAGNVIMAELEKRDRSNEDALNDRGEEMPENTLLPRERQVIYDLSLKAVDKNGVEPGQAVSVLLAAYDELRNAGKSPQEALATLRALAK